MNYKFSEYKPFDLLEGHLKMGETSKNGDTIDVNNLYITKNGKPFFPVMAEMHYARVTRDQWEDRILKMKANGINVISSYVFWIKHEPVEGQFDFTGDNDLHYFIELCQKHGMYFALRVGPWITAECRNGGLPEWLYLKGIPLRQNNEQFLYYTYRWYQAIYDQVKDFMFRDGGNIIMIQFDNEVAINPDYLRKLKEMALEIGFSAPIYTATGWSLKGGAMLPKDEMVPVWGGYAAKPWTDHIEPINFYGHYRFCSERASSDIGNDQIEVGDTVVNLPNDRYPYLFAELGTGIPTSKMRRPVITDYDNYAFSLVKLGCGNNMPGYYLFTGGKHAMGPGYTLNWSNNSLNPSARTYPVFNYDFEAPVGEYGNLKDSYRYLRLLNHFTNSYGEELATMQAVLQAEQVKKDDTEKLRYAMRTDGKSGYIFVNNHIHLLDKKAVKDVQFQLHDGTVIPATPINVKESVSFFIPFNITYGKLTAEYATAQPLLKYGDTYFFVEVEGVEPVYKFHGKEEIKAQLGKENGFVLDGQTFITLTIEEAKYLCQFGDRLLMGDGCDLLINGEELLACNKGDFAYYEFIDGKFVHATVKGEYNPPASVTYKEVPSAVINPVHLWNLHNMRKGGGRRKLHYFEIDLADGKDGYLYIDYSGDSAQLYLDGEMYDDNFYTGIPWPLPIKDLQGKKIVLIIAEYTEDIYVDIPLKQVAGIDKLTICDR